MSVSFSKSKILFSSLVLVFFQALMTSRFVLHHSSIPPRGTGCLGSGNETYEEEISLRIDWWWQSPLAMDDLKHGFFLHWCLPRNLTHGQAEVFCRSLLSRAWPVNHPWRRHTLTRRTSSSAFTRSRVIFPIYIYTRGLRLFYEQNILSYTHPILYY